MHYLSSLAYAFILCFMARHCLAGVLYNRYNAASSREHYAQAHSLGDNYQFDPRDGWNTVNVTNSQHKHRHQVESAEKRESKHISSKKSKSKSKSKAGSGSRFPSVADIGKALTGFGKSSDVTITWYTGHDLMNPSCWSNGDWAPSDQSFVGAVTLEGWTNRPKCFNFIELCSSSTKCVFVRIVDTCAGCAKGSQHVDLTKGAFMELASLDDGKLSVHMRPATNPVSWFVDLWGPKK